MSDQWTDRLSEYLDGQLEPAEHAECERHVATCAECAGTLESLRLVTARARALPERPIGVDLWPGIAARIQAEAAPRVVKLPDTRRRFSFTFAQAAAAALLLAVLSGGAVWWTLRGPWPGRVAQAPPTVALAPEASGVATFAGFDERHYDAAVADLENALKAHRAELDTSTVRVLEQNLAIIDRSIAQARTALAADPASAYLNGHLARQMMAKLDLLRRATALHEARG